MTDVFVPNGAPIVPPELVQQALAQPAPRDLPRTALTLIADTAAQSPLVGQWLSGWFAAHGHDTPAQQVRLVIDAAHVEVGDGG